MLVSETEDYVRAEELFSADYAYFFTPRAVGSIMRPAMRA